MEESSNFRRPDLPGGVGRRGFGRERGVNSRGRGMGFGNGPQEKEEGLDGRKHTWRGSDRARGNAGRVTRGLRPSYRGRANRGHDAQVGWRTDAQRSTVKREAIETQPKGKLIENITLSRVQSAHSGKDEKLMIEDCEYVASYSWIDSRASTILIPGAPPAWDPPVEPPALEQDGAEYYRDPNFARWPSYPTEPAIRAVYAVNPEFSQDIDVVCCGNTMGNLLGFAGSSDGTFRFNIEIVEDTAFLVRKGAFPEELIENVWGYGHTFPEAYTSWGKGLKGSVSHQRLIKYTFGGLKILFRSECDGFLEEKATRETERSKSQPPFQNQSLDVDALSVLLAEESMRVSERPPSNGKDLKIKHGGQVIPQAALFDLKTRSVKNELNMEEIYPRLWLSQTPISIVAYHKSGHFDFDNIRVQDLPEKFEKWETEKQQLLWDFRTTVDMLIKTAKAAPECKVEVRRVGSGPLEIRKLFDSSWSCLPRSLKARWAGDSDIEDDLGDSDEADYLKF